KIALCYGRLVTLPALEQHLHDLRASRRYEPAQIGSLHCTQPQGRARILFLADLYPGGGFRSRTFRLRLFHGLVNANTPQRSGTCGREDYPIVYFVGSRVRTIESGTIEVSREKEVVNVISLKDLAPALVSGCASRFTRASACSAPTSARDARTASSTNG